MSNSATRVIVAKPLQSAHRRRHSIETPLLTWQTTYTTLGLKSIRYHDPVGLVGSVRYDWPRWLVQRMQHTFGIAGLAARLDSILPSRPSFVCQLASGQSATSASDISVSQGSFLGPLLFTLCVAPLAKVTTFFGTQHHEYSDSAYLYIFVSKEELTTKIQTMKRCTDALYNWLSHNSLALNPSKSEVIQFGVAQARYTKNVVSIRVAGAISWSSFIKSFGVILDSHLTFDDHVVAVCKACYFHIHESIPNNVANMVACCIVRSRLDYCNSLLIQVFRRKFCKVAARPKYIAHRNRNKAIWPCQVGGHPHHTCSSRAALATDEGTNYIKTSDTCLQHPSTVRHHTLSLSDNKPVRNLW